MKKFSEVACAGPVTTWFPLDNYQQYTAFARAGDVSPLDTVTIQLRKATDAGGSNATNHGDPVNLTPTGGVSVRAEDLGDFSATLQYKYVSAVVTDEDSPNTVTSYAVLTEPRYQGKDALE